MMTKGDAWVASLEKPEPMAGWRLWNFAREMGPVDGRAKRWLRRRLSPKRGRVERAGVEHEPPVVAIAGHAARVGCGCIAALAQAVVKDES